MRKINLKFITTSFLFVSTFSSQGGFAGTPLRTDDPYPGGGGLNTPSLSMAQIETVSPVTYDIIGSNQAICFNSNIGTATVTIQDQYGSTIYQSVVNTNTQSVLYVPIENWETGSYTITVTSESTNFVSGFQL